MWCFTPTQQYVLQIALVGLHINKDGNGNLEMTPINFEHFRIPSDDVMMTTTTCTADGRIFLGGNDGHLYELEYRNRESWLRGRCNKVGHTTSSIAISTPVTLLWSFLLNSAGL